MNELPPGFDQWVLAARFDSDDPLWRMMAYRLARYAGDSAWEDADLIRRRPLGWSVADQLLRATLSIGANIAEGYSRSSGRDRVRMYEYALGSVRESLLWYDASRHILPSDVTETRTFTLISVRRLLLAIIPRERRRNVDARDPARS